MGKSIKDYVRELYDAYESVGQTEFFPGDMHMPEQIEYELNLAGILDTQNNIAGSACFDPEKALKFLNK